MFREVIQADELAEVLVWVEPTWAGGWSSKVKLLLVIGRAPAGHEVGYEELAERTGVAVSTVRRSMAELREASVLIQLARGGGGNDAVSRFACHRVNPDLHRWRDVPWRELPGTGRPVPVSLVEQYAFQRAPREFVAPVSDRRFRRRGERFADGKTLATRGERFGGAETLAMGGRRFAGGQSAERRGVVTGGRPVEGLAGGLGGDDRIRSASTGGQQQQLGYTSEVLASAEKVGRAVVAKALAINGRKFINGSAKETVRRLVAEHGEVMVMAALEFAPDDCGVPMLVEYVEGTLRLDSIVEDQSDAVAAIVEANRPQAPAAPKLCQECAGAGEVRIEPERPPGYEGQDGAKRFIQDVMAKVIPKPELTFEKCPACAGAGRMLDSDQEAAACP